MNDRLAGHGSPFAVATHESGHAVVFSVLGVQYSSVTIVPDDRTAGRVTGQPAEAHRRALPFLLGLLAGSLAESVITGRPLHEVTASCGALDIAAADELCTGMDAAASTVLIARAGQLVQRNLRAISAVAADLVVCQTLAAADVEQIVAQYPPASLPSVATNNRPGEPR